MWRIPQSLIDSGDDSALLCHVLGELVDPEAFLSKVRTLYGSCEEDRDLLFFKDGRTFERFSAPIVLDNNNIGRVWSFRDITDRRRVEEALRDSEERYRSIIHASPDNITIADMHGRIDMTSPMAVSMFGYDREEDALGLLITDFIIPEDRERALATLARKLQGIASGSSSTAVYGGTEMFDIEVNSEFIRGIDRQPKRIVIIARDISRRKQTEEALREGDKKFRTLFEGSRDALMTLTPPSWHFTSCNTSTREMFRANNTEEFLSYGPGQLSPERQADGRLSSEKAMEMIDIALREGSHYFEWTHRADRRRRFSGSGPSSPALSLTVNSPSRRP